MPPLADLLARLREATEGSWELDCLIHNAVEGSAYDEDAIRYLSERNICDECGWDKGDVGDKYCVPRYSRSLDAAMTLVPDGWYIHTLEGVPSKDEWFACLKQDGVPWLSTWGRASENVGSRTLPLALCIAALWCI